MLSLRTLLSDTVGRLLFRELTVTRAVRLAPGFRHLVLAGPTLVGLDVAAGDKLQLAVPDAGLRTYTPFAVDRVRGQLEVIAYLHGAGPGARWAAQVGAGDVVRAFGPRRSLEFGAVRRPIVAVGDETSLGLVHALRDHGEADGLRVVLEASAPANLEAALAAAGLPGTVVTAGDSTALDLAVRQALAGLASPTLVVTGNARTIQDLRSSLRRDPVPGAAIVARAYWAPGKRGLD